MFKKPAYIIIGILLLFIITMCLLLIYGVNAAITKIAPANAKILFIGSSTTAATNSYADKINQHYPETTINKIAEIGAVTGWMKDNSTAEIQTGTYNVVCILGGLNDIYATGSTTEAKNNITSMINTAKQYNCITVLVTVQPTHYYAAYSDYKGELTQDLNEWILNSSNADIVIDLYSMLIDSNGNQNTNLFQPDNLHLTDQAQNMLALEIENNLFI